MTREQKIPDASHPITVTPTAGRVQVVAGGSVIADTTASLTLQEALPAPAVRADLRDRSGRSRSDEHLDVLPVQG